ncbi:hypothetical protein AVEN_247850-1 [Araneus ventricosus]|uniref:Uncharacterized protein n=1 Tax=Araneus ventricosus TaxID=182803 RepID=A0A4Y2IDQ3_ARAVE|nr:hypothetical protein AVEN_247850-1 [Araneus ventricosus]
MHEPPPSSPRTKHLGPASGWTSGPKRHELATLRCPMKNRHVVYLVQVTSVGIKCPPVVELRMFEEWEPKPSAQLAIGFLVELGLRSRLQLCRIAHASL